MTLDLVAAIVGVLASAVGTSGVLREFIQRARPAKDLNLDPRALQSVADTLRQEMGSKTGPTPPTEPGKAPSSDSPAEIEALAIMELYGRELIAEARRIAWRAGAERPSKKHVRQAADRIGVLRDRAGVSADVALAIGSLLVGAAVSYQVNLWTGGTAQSGTGIWFTITLAVGVGVIVAAAAIKWRRT